MSKKKKKKDLLGNGKQFYDHLYTWTLQAISNLKEVLHAG